MTDVTTTRLNRPGSLWRRIWNCRVLYLLILPLIVWYVMFCYVPMAGLYLAFERFSYKGGIWGSAWVGLNNFREFLTDGEFLRSLRNTVIFSLGKLALQFPMAIMLALALNELQHARIKKIYQTVFTFPSQYYALSVTEEYLALEGGPSCFPQGFPCLVVLWFLPASHQFRLRDFHPL